MDLEILTLGIALIAGFYLAFNIGANDVANNVGTAVGSRALKIKHAIIIAAIFEFLGAFLLGDHVTNTIKQGFVDQLIFADDPMGFAYGMTAAILSTSLWLQYGTMKGLPVSTTHSIVGAVLGFAIVKGGAGYIKYAELLYIFSSWFISPILGGIISYCTIKFILRFIIETKNPIIRARYLVPLLVFLVVSILSTTFTIRPFNNFEHKEFFGWCLAILLGLIIASLFTFIAFKIQIKHDHRKLELYQVESLFAKVQLVSVCFLAFAHGSNDVANAIGPASAVITAINTKNIMQDGAAPGWLLFLGAVGIVFGVSVFGRKVIQTVGKHITLITPTRGFAAELGASITILFGSVLGLPLSTTHVLVGSVMGVGLARGLGGIDINVMKKIARSWVITMPATMLISMILCFILQLF